MLDDPQYQPEAQFNGAVDEAESRPDRWQIVLLAVVFGVAGLVWCAVLPDGHYPRVLGVLGALWFGCWLALSLCRRQDWHVRGYGLALGIGLSTAAWWFMPTTSGQSLWTAQEECKRRIADLEAAPAGNIAAFRQGELDRKDLVVQFPELYEQVEQAEREWVKRSEPIWIEDLTRVPVGDLTAFVELRRSYEPFLSDPLRRAEESWFERSFEDILPGEYAAARKVRDVAQTCQDWSATTAGAEERWVNRTIAAALKANVQSLRDDPEAASRDLQQSARTLVDYGAFAAAQERLLVARRQALLGRLELARRQGRTLLIDDHYQAALSAAVQFEKDCSAEAQAVGVNDELIKFRAANAFLVELAQRANKVDSKR